MAVYCWKCGTQVSEGRVDCQKCRAPIHRPGLWERLRMFFSPPIVGKRSDLADRTHPSVPAPQNAQPGSHGEETAKEALSGDQVLDPTVLPPEVRRRMENGERVVLTTDELPEVLRSQFRVSLGSAAKFNFTTKTSTIYRFRDASGNERVFHSLDEMPPEIRKAMEGARLPDAPQSESSGRK